MTDPLRDGLAVEPGHSGAAEPVFMEAFGKLRHLRAETQRIQRRIDRAFEVIEPEDRA